MASADEPIGRHRPRSIEWWFAQGAAFYNAHRAICQPGLLVRTPYYSGRHRKAGADR